MGRLLRILPLAAGLMLLVVAVGYGQSTAIVDYDADEAFSVPVGDSTATALVGNVIFHHNGAILACDSALLYNRNYIECFRNVIINRDSTYVYGDRADFNGITNIARVYAPIVKTLDGDVAMYSYNMEFNTLTNIGRYTTGGTIRQKDNVMESRQAIYHADERQVYFEGNVVMRNEEYIIRTDSMGYNFDTEVTHFYRPATIWNNDGDFLSADQGSYDRAGDTYSFTKNSYILTGDDQEVFADSITYVKPAALAYLFRDIQLHDPAQRVYLFGGYGVFWEAARQAVMTENPSGISYEQGERPDSAYLRGDTIFMHTLPWQEAFTPEAAARLRLPGREELDSVRRGLLQAVLPAPDSLVMNEAVPPADSLSNWAHLYGAGADTVRLQYGMQGVPVDSLPAPPLATGADSLAAPEVVPEAVVQETPEAEQVAPADPLPENAREQRRARRLERRKERMRVYAAEQGLIPADTAAVERPDSLTAGPDEIVPQPDSVQRDSLQRVIRAYPRVKIYRHDLQAVADSLVAFSLDSTAHLYVHPVLWNEDNQVTADSIHLRSRNQQLDRADFVGGPIMAQWVMDSLYNQIAGDLIETFFHDNAIREMRVLGNAKSYYYMQEEGKPNDIAGFLDVQSRDLVFRFDSARVQQIVYLADIKSAQYPMDRIPPEHTQRLSGFEWLPERRPMSPQQVCDRDIRPSQREQSRALAYPPFRITERMEADKKRYTEQELWRDRTDTLRLDPAYFLNLIR